MYSIYPRVKMDESLEELAARAEVYGLLSQAYHTPEVGFLRGDFLGSLVLALDTLAPNSLAEEVKSLENYLQALQDSVEITVEYTRLFRGPVKAAVYPYESMYTEDEIMGMSTLDVVRRYGEAGIGVSEEFKDLPDHISAELEFMRYLCLHELAALQKGDDTEATRFRFMGQSFAKDHLGRWLPRFTSRLLQCTTLPFYLCLARITQEFVSREATPLERVAEIQA